MAGIFLLVLSFPDMLSSKNSSKDNTVNQDYKMKDNNLNTETQEEGDAYTT